MRAALWHRCHVCPTRDCVLPATSGECLACDERNRQLIAAGRTFPKSLRAYFRDIGITYSDKDDPALPLSSLNYELVAPPYEAPEDPEDRIISPEAMGFLWRSHVVQSLGSGERQAAAWLAAAYGSQGQIASILGVNQATVSRDQGNVRRLLRINFDDDFVAAFDAPDPIEGRRAMSRPRLVA